MPSTSQRERLPPISALLHPLDPQDTSYGISLQQPRGPPRFPEAQVLAPSPLAGRGRSTFPPPHGEYSSESTISTEFTDRRGSYASTASPVMTSARGSHMLPSVAGMHGSHGGVSLEPGQDSLSMYGDGEPSYSHGGASGGGYDMRGAHPEYAQYARHSQYSSQGGAPPGYAMGLDQMGTDYGDSKQKRRRGNLPKQVTDILRQWFHDHVAHPYPTEDEKQQLMSQTGLTLSQISNWFINARRRSLPQMHRQAQTETEVRDGAMQLNHN